MGEVMRVALRRSLRAAVLGDREAVVVHGEVVRRACGDFSKAGGERNATWAAAARSKRAEVRKEVLMDVDRVGTVSESQLGKAAIQGRQLVVGERVLWTAHPREKTKRREGRGRGESRWERARQHL